MHADADFDVSEAGGEEDLDLDEEGEDDLDVNLGADTSGDSNSSL